MDNSTHRAHGLREAEIELELARHMPSRRRFATLSGILSLLEDAGTKCMAADADPQSKLATEIRDLKAKTKRQYRNLLITYGMIAAAVLVVGTIAGWRLRAMPNGDSTLLITNPRAGDPVDMSISVSGSSPRGSLPAGSQLYVLVKPQGLNYWLQPLPEVGSTGWRVEKAGIGLEADPGKSFRICALLTGTTLLSGWNAPDMPPGDAHCVDVTRK